MLRKIVAFTVLATLGISAPLILTGCQTAGSEPYGVKGGTPTEAERNHYTDDKGRFHYDAWAVNAKPFR